MKIFQNKAPRSWKSSGIIIKNNQIEMSNFSFIEDYVNIKENKFSISIIGKNIIGNGLFSISIYKSEFLVWKESFCFKNISFSKKIIEIEEEPETKFKIVISRGRESRGKIIIDSISIFSKETEQLKQENKNITQEAEDEPTFFLEERKEELLNIEDDKLEPVIFLKEKTEDISLEMIEDNQAIITEDLSSHEMPTISVADSGGTTPIELPLEIGSTAAEKGPEEITSQPTVIKKEKKPKVGLLKKRKITKIQGDTIISEEQPLEENIAIEEVREERKRNNIWIHILDLSSTTDEREIFKYINQISFGKGRQTFLVKNNSEVNLSKYEHVIICIDDDQVIFELNNLNPNKITFSEANLSLELLEKVQKIKDEI